VRKERFRASARTLRHTTPSYSGVSTNSHLVAQLDGVGSVEVVVLFGEPFRAVERRVRLAERDVHVSSKDRGVEIVLALLVSGNLDDLVRGGGWAGRWGAGR